ncbi:MAG: hypothetical protein ACOYMB_03355 [Patescibacteria group bacterium]
MKKLSMLLIALVLIFSARGQSSATENKKTISPTVCEKIQLFKAAKTDADNLLTEIKSNYKNYEKQWKKVISFKAEYPNGSHLVGLGVSGFGALSEMRISTALVTLQYASDLLNEKERKELNKIIEDINFYHSINLYILDELREISI